VLKPVILSPAPLRPCKRESLDQNQNSLQSAWSSKEPLFIQSSIINQLHKHLFSTYSIPEIMLFTIGEQKWTRSEQEFLPSRCSANQIINYLTMHWVCWWRLAQRVHKRSDKPTPSMGKSLTQPWESNSVSHRASKLRFWNSAWTRGLADSLFLALVGDAILENTTNFSKPWFTHLPVELRIAAAL
jgi:hypothetical protein